MCLFNAIQLWFDIYHSIFLSIYMSQLERLKRSHLQQTFFFHRKQLNDNMRKFMLRYTILPKKCHFWNANTISEIFILESYDPPKRARPLAIRRFKTRLPPTERCLSKNPCFRRFRIMLGWKVRLIHIIHSENMFKEIETGGMNKFIW